MIEKAIRDRLLADAGVAALTDRVINGKMRQRDTFPLITLKKIDKVSTLTLEGAAGPNQVRMQVDCWDVDVDGVCALVDAVNGNDSQSSRGALHGFAGLSGGERLKLVQLIVERDAVYESDTKLHRVGADYMVHL